MTNTQNENIGEKIHDAANRALRLPRLKSLTVFHVEMMPNFECESTLQESIEGEPKCAGCGSCNCFETMFGEIKCEDCQKLWPQERKAEIFPDDANVKDSTEQSLRRSLDAALSECEELQDNLKKEREECKRLRTEADEYYKRTQDLSAKMLCIRACCEELSKKVISEEVRESIGKIWHLA